MTEILPLDLTQAELRQIIKSARARLNEMSEPNRVCIQCESAFTGRAKSIYCSPKCRTASHRRRHAKIGRMPTSTNIVSIGYEGRSLDDFVSILKIRGVDALVDVRKNAISRKRGFSKTALSEALNAIGIEYRHYRSLGNEKDNRDGYAEVGTPKATDARQRFCSVLAGEQATSALDEVRVLAITQRVALFCYEHEETHCHREQVREALLQ